MREGHEIKTNRKGKKRGIKEQINVTAKFYFMVYCGVSRMVVKTERRGIHFRKGETEVCKEVFIEAPRVCFYYTKELKRGPADSMRPAISNYAALEAQFYINIPRHGTASQILFLNPNKQNFIFFVHRS